MTARPRLLVVGGKDSGFRSLAELDADITLLQDRSGLSPLQVERSDSILVLPAWADEPAAALAEALHRSSPFGAVLSFNEQRLQLASDLGARLGAVHNPPDAVRMTRDKAGMRRHLAEHGLSTVRFAACGRASDVASFLALVGPPIILKPVRGSGSRGVTLVKSSSEVDIAWARCTATEQPPAIAEEFVTGREFSVEALTLDGAHSVLAVTEKLTTGPPSFIELGHQLPARLDPATKAAIDRLTIGVLDAIGHRWGPSHTEVIVAADGTLTVVETQTRFGGDQIWEMVELVCGVRLAAATAAAMLGMDVTAKAESGRPPTASAAAVRFLGLEDVVVISVGETSAIERMPGVVRAHLSLTEGQVVGPLRGSGDRQGYVLATADTTDDAVRRVEAAVDALQIDVEPA